MACDRDIDALYRHDALLLCLRDACELENMICLFKTQLRIIDLREEARVRKVPTAFPASAGADVVPESDADERVDTFFVRVLVIAAAFCLVEPLVSALAGILGVWKPYDDGFLGRLEFFLIGLALTVAFWAAVSRAAVKRRRRERERERKWEELLEQGRRLDAQRREFLLGACDEASAALTQCYELDILPETHRNRETLSRLCYAVDAHSIRLAQALSLDVCQGEDPYVAPSDDVQELEGRSLELLRFLDAGYTFDRMRTDAAMLEGSADVDALIAIDVATITAQVVPSLQERTVVAHARALRTREKLMSAYVLGL